MSGLWEARARAAAAAVLSAEPGSLRVEPLGLRAGREVYLCGRDAELVVAKCYPDLGRARTASHALELFATARGPLRTPVCLLLDEAGFVVVQTYLRGTPLSAGLRGPEAPVAIRLLARAVAELHGLGLDLPRRLDRTAAVAAVASASPRVRGGEGRLARSALARAFRELESCPPLPLVPSHGDLGLAQLVDCGNAIGIVDFDKAVQAEPALDLGNLVAQLVRSRGEQGVAMAERLADAYVDMTCSDVRPAVRPYAWLVLIRKLAWLPEQSRAPVRQALERLLLPPDKRSR